jgi:NADPH2:quinone reductase
MRAIVIQRHGSTEVFEDIETADPKPRPGYVVVDVKATSVNPIDTKIREGSEGTPGTDVPRDPAFRCCGYRAIGRRWRYEVPAG